jgi:hypothetical protein
MDLPREISKVSTGEKCVWMIWAVYIKKNSGSSGEYRPGLVLLAEDPQNLPEGDQIYRDIGMQLSEGAFADVQALLQQ